MRRYCKSTGPSRGATQRPAALVVCILTATRPSETLGATWAEIDVGKGLWTIAAKHMKAGVKHCIPLSVGALEILQEVGTGKV